jgi:hypothetical protein
MPPKRRPRQNGDDKFVFSSSNKVKYGVGQGDNPRAAPFALQPTWLSGVSNTRMANAFLDGALQTTPSTALEYFQPSTNGLTQAGTIGAEIRERLDDVQKLKGRILDADVSKLTAKKAEYKSFINLEDSAWMNEISSRLDFVQRTKKSSHSEVKKFLEKDFRFTMLDSIADGIRQGFGLPRPTAFSKEQCQILFKRITQLDPTLLTAPLSTLYQVFSCVGGYDLLRDLYRSKMLELSAVVGASMTTMGKAIIRWFMAFAKRLIDACTAYDLPQPDDLVNMADGQPPPPPPPGGGSAGSAGTSGGSGASVDGGSVGGTGGGGMGGGDDGDGGGGGTPMPTTATNIVSPDLSMTSDATIQPATPSPTTIQPTERSTGYTSPPSAPTESPAIEGDGVVKSSYSPYLLYAIRFLLSASAASYLAFKAIRYTREDVAVDRPAERAAEAVVVRARGHIRQVPDFLAQTNPVLFWTSNVINTIIASSQVVSWEVISTKFAEWARYCVQQEVANEGGGRMLFDGISIAEAGVDNREFQLANLMAREDTPQHLREPLRLAIEYLRQQRGGGSTVAESSERGAERPNRDEARVDTSTSAIIQRLDQLQTLTRAYTPEIRGQLNGLRRTIREVEIMGAFILLVDENRAQFLTPNRVNILDVIRTSCNLFQLSWNTLFYSGGNPTSVAKSAPFPTMPERITRAYLASLEDFVNNDLVKAYFDLRSQQPFVKKFDTFVKRLIDVVSDYLNIQAEASAAATMVRP